MKRDKHLRFIKSEIGIDASPLPDDAVEKLAQYAINVIALEAPQAAKFVAQENDLTITLGK